MAIEPRRRQGRTGGRRSRTGTPDLAGDVVRKVLEHYADRGAFRSFSENGHGGSKRGFRFTWFRDLPFYVTFNERSRMLTFEDLLPAVPARSRMARDLREFLIERESPSLPDHRRIDRRKMRITVVVRRHQVSLACRLSRPQIEYGVRKAVNVVHEIFTDFLSDGRFIDYQIEHLRLDPELA